MHKAIVFEHPHQTSSIAGVQVTQVGAHRLKLELAHFSFLSVNGHDAFRAAAHRQGTMPANTSKLFMYLRYLHYLRLVIDHGSFAAASRAAGVTQPAISHGMAQL